MASDRMLEALHRYNVGPDWSRSEVVELVKATEVDAERLREDVRTMVEMLMDDPAQLTGHAAGCILGLMYGGPDG